MSNDEDLKKQLKAIQIQLAETHKEILQTRLDVNNSQAQTHVDMLETRIDVVTTAKNTLQANMESMKLAVAQLQINAKTAEINRKQSDLDLYWSIFMSAIIGVTGNQFVTLLYAPQTEANSSGLLFVGFFLLVPLAMLIYLMHKSRQSIKVLSQKPQTTVVEKVIA